MLFPHGLEQAPDVHFSLDSLLLAAFPRGNNLHVLDLGVGCGVVGLGLLQRSVAWTVEGLDIDMDQVACASANALKLGLSDRFHVRYGDVRCADDIAGEDCDLVVCNPPWRLTGSERLPRSTRRQRAFYGEADTLLHFAAAGSARLVKGGRFAVVLAASRLADMLAAWCHVQIFPARLRFVHARRGRDATFALVEGRYRVQTALHVESPLFLYADGAACYSAEAVAFCRWLTDRSRT